MAKCLIMYWYYHTCLMSQFFALTCFLTYSFWRCALVYDCWRHPEFLLCSEKERKSNSIDKCFPTIFHLIGANSILLEQKRFLQNLLFQILEKYLLGNCKKDSLPSRHSKFWSKDNGKRTKKEKEWKGEGLLCYTTLIYKFASP